MIALLRGRPELVNDQLIVEVGGVGYLVHVSSRLASQLARQDEVILYIYSHVREDSFDLYGFPSWAERTLFTLIISVSGVGPATALHMFNYPSETITTAIQEADVGFFTKIPRIGKKSAQKIIIELSSKLGEMKALQLGPQTGQYREVVDSLVGLGFDEDAIQEILNQLDIDELGVEATVKQVISTLSKKK